LLTFFFSFYAYFFLNYPFLLFLLLSSSLFPALGRQPPPWMPAATSTLNQLLWGFAERERRGAERGGVGEEILSQAKPDEPEMFDVVNDRNTLKEPFLGLCKLKQALSLVDLPEMKWLTDSLLRAQDNMHTLQEEISTIKESSRNYIDQLSFSLLLA